MRRGGLDAAQTASLARIAKGKIAGVRPLTPALGRPSGIIPERGSVASVSLVVRSGASGCLESTGVPYEHTLSVARITLLQNAPNPFNPQTTITFAVSDRTAVSLRVFDLAGHLVTTLLDNEVVGRGQVEAEWNGRDATGRLAAAGTYFYRLEVAGDSQLADQR